MQYVCHIISERRKELGVSLEMLTNGLCHFSFLKKIENNEMYADKFLMDFILQRLGIADSFEHYLKLEDYIEQKMREDIIEYYKADECSKIQPFLEKYKTIVDSSANIHRQFIAYVEMLIKGECDILELQKIIEFTVIEFQKKPLHQLVLSEFELFYIVEFTKQLILIKKTDGEILFKDIYMYLNNEHLEHGIRRRFLPIVTSYVVDGYISKREYQTAYKICYETIEFMREMLELNFLPLLIEQLIFLMEKVNVIDDKFKNWKEMLLEFYQSKNVEPNNSFVDVFRGRQYHIINDVIKRRRLMFGISQQKLADDICDVKTISRLESGKTTMHTKKVCEIMKKLNLSGQIYDECAVTDDYEQFVLVKKAKVAMAHNDFVTTDKIICLLEQKIDLNIKRNLQYINHEKVLIDQFSNGVNLTVCLEKYRECLEITGVKKASVMQLTNREANIIINMICCLYELGEYDEMEEWFGVLGNSLNDCWHLSSYSLYLNVLFSMRANLGDFHKAFEILSKLVQYNLTTNRFANIHFITYLEAKYYKEQIEEERTMTDDEILRYKKLVSIAEVVCDITKDSHVLGLIKKYCSFP